MLILQEGPNYFNFGFVVSQISKVALHDATTLKIT